MVSRKGLIYNSLKRELIVRALASALIIAFVYAAFSCDSDDHHDHHHGDFIEDVHVTISGDGGTEFDGFFEDDKDVQTVSGQIPFDATFLEQIGFFHAVVDKTESGAAELCLEVRSSGTVRQVCTREPFGQVSVTISF